MNQIGFNMKDWHIKKQCSITCVYEGENGVAEIFISCSPESDCEYQLHRILNGEIRYIVMDAADDGLHCTLTSKFLAADGEVTMQIRAVYSDGRIKESNKFYIAISDSINATEEL